MRLLMIATGYLPYLFSENLCNAKLVYALHEAGIQVDVISKRDDGPTYGSAWTEPWLCLKDAVHELNYAPGNKLSAIADTLRSAAVMDMTLIEGIRWARRAYDEALRLIKANHYDAILTRSPSDIPHLVGYKLKQKTGIRWIANWNDPATPIWPEPYKHHLSPSKQASKERFTAKMLRAADINTFPSDSLRRHFASFFPFLNDSRTEVVPHIGMAPSLMAFCKKTAVITRDEDPSILTLCHSGNMSGERNPEHLFTAMRQLIDEGHTNFRLDIMGRPNPQTDQLVDRYNLRDHVRCIGSFGYMEAVNRLHAYDVLVLLEAILDRGIFFASKFTDYAQTSQPILAVSPPDGFARDILAAHGGGLHADNTSPAPIRDALLTLLRHKADNTLHTLSSANLFAHFAPERVVEQYKSMAL